MNNQEISANQNGGNEDGMDESAFTTPSLAESEISIAEKMQKIESELLALKRSNEIQREQAAPTMMQVGWQIGEKFCKLEMKVDGQDKEIAGFRGENKELKCENRKLKEEIAGLKAEMVEKDEKMQEMSNELAELRRESGQFKQAIVGNKRALDSKFDELQIKVARFEENQQTSTSGDAAINQQLFECIDGVMNGAILSLENQLFAFMTNSNALKHNKWEKNESGLKFGEDGFTVNSNAPKGFKTVSAEFPIRLFNIVGMVKRKCVPCYFEVKLVNGSNVEKTIRVGIGFCGQDFPLDGVGIGGRSGSIGLYCPEGMSIDGQLMPFEEQNAIPIDTNFRKGDIVGCGLLYSPTNSTLRCFATLRGKFIGSILLRPKYHTRMLYPAASLYFDQESIRANFGAQPFHFNPTQLLDK